MPFRDAIVADIRPTLIVLVSGVGLLLLIAYVNLVSLLLVRRKAGSAEGDAESWVPLWGG